MTNETARVWPTGTDYARAVQSPLLSFSDASLSLGKAGTNAMGMPLVASGQNAVVFLLETASSKVAVRCFLTPPHEGAIRYAALERHLENTAPRALTAARWLSEGITVGDVTWPVVVMPWVSGLPLNLAVEDMLDDSAGLIDMAERWGEVLRSLQRAGVAHGDLQHGNVLVKEGGSFALVDLDGVWVPEIEVGPPAEYGHPNYQHAQRSNDHWGKYVDSFPGALIQLALRALAVDPSLGRFLNGENLLFTRLDLQDPDGSDLWSSLCELEDPGVASMAVALRGRCKGPIGAVLVPFDQILDEAPVDLTVLRTAPAPPPASLLVTPSTSTAAAPPAPWWEQGVGSPNPSSVDVAPAAAAVASALPATKSRAVFALGRNTVIAGLVGGAAAGIVGSRATVLVDSALNEQKETIAFVVFISMLLGGFLRSTQMLLARNWAAGALHFVIGVVVGGGAGLIAIPLADLVVRAVSTDKAIPDGVGTALYTPAMVSAPLFAIVAGMVGLALGLLRSTKTGLATLAAGVVGGALGGAIFGATVAEYRNGFLDVSFLSIPTIAIVALVGASIGVTYGFAVRARRSATLTIIEGRNSGMEISIEGRSATIGSKSTCDLVLRGDSAVAGVHATLTMDGGSVRVDPMGGRVLVNGVSLGGGCADLASGDVLMVGCSYIRMELKGAS